MLAVKRRWTGEATDLDRRAGRDPRQTHFFFYMQPDPPAGAPDPGKKRPGSASGDDNRPYFSARVKMRVGKGVRPLPPLRQTQPRDSRSSSADYPVVLSQNRAAPRLCPNLSHSISDWSFTMVREPDSPSLHTASEALAALTGLVGVSADGFRSPDQHHS